MSMRQLSTRIVSTRIHTLYLWSPLSQLGQHEHSNPTTTPSSQPVRLVSTDAMIQPNSVHQNLQASPRASRTTPIRQEAQHLVAIAPNLIGEKGASPRLKNLHRPRGAPTFLRR